TGTYGNHRKCSAVMALAKYIAHLARVTERRLALHFSEHPKRETEVLPAFPKGTDEMGLFIKKNKLNDAEALLLVTALVPHIDPVIFDNILQRYLESPGDFPQFGG